MELTVNEAKRRIFELVCSESQRSKNPDVVLRAQATRVQLELPVEVFARAMDAFVHGHSHMYIEVFVKDGERHLRLGPAGKSYCAEGRAPF